MTKKCFVCYGQGVGYGSGNGYYYEDIFCAETVVFQREPSNPYTGNTPWDRLVIDGNPSPNQGYYAGTGVILQITAYPLADQYCPNPRGGRSGNCDACLSPPRKYDCINGNCIDASQYNTPGIYQSLTDCQAVCANGGACAEGKQCVDPTNFCPSGKVCIDQGEFASIEALISKINSEVC